VSFLSIPDGFEDPTRCKISKCKTAKPAIANGSKKCTTKKRFNVGLSTEKPPHTHTTLGSPITGSEETLLVITVAPQ
jgi:hypothetical protein